MSYVRSDGIRAYAYPHDALPAVVQGKPGSTFSYSQTSSGTSSTHRRHCQAVLTGKVASSGTSQTVTKSYYDECLVTVDLSGADSGHTVSTEAHTRFGLVHKESGLYDSWSDWCDNGAVLRFSASTTGSPPRTTPDTRKWTVLSSFTATINYVGP